MNKDASEGRDKGKVAERFARLDYRLFVADFFAGILQIFYRLSTDYSLYNSHETVETLSNPYRGFVIITRFRRKKTQVRSNKDASKGKEKVFSKSFFKF